MRDLKQAHDLLTVAGHDLRALRHMLDPASFSEAIFGFHAQQAVEKALKALLCLRGVEYEYTHDLEALLEQLGKAGEPGLEPYLPLAELTAFAVQFRYDVYEDRPVDRTALLGAVEGLVALVETRYQATMADG
jgi:HEPN domain-containing protein